VSVRTCCGAGAVAQGDTKAHRVGWSRQREGERNERNIALLRSGTPEARNPLYPKLPRHVTVRAVEDISFLSIESDLLDVMYHLGSDRTYEVAELQAHLQSVGSDAG